MKNKEKMLKNFKIIMKQDGYDYEKLVLKILNKQIATKALFNGHNPQREVYYLQYDNRHFVFKNDREISKHFEKRLWQRISSPFYSKLFKKVNKAVNKGCDITQDIYFVAEKTKYGLPTQSYILFEFIEGQPLQQFEESTWPKYFGKISQTMQTLHKYGLASNDLHPGNFIITPHKIKIIDLSPTGLYFTARVNDFLNLKKIFGLKLPIKKIHDKIYFIFLTLKNRFRKKS